LFMEIEEAAASQTRMFLAIHSRPLSVPRDYLLMSRTYKRLAACSYPHGNNPNSFLERGSAGSASTIRNPTLRATLD
jgi:hypothetical protein